MLYMTALGPPGSALEILKTTRSSLPACSVPCHDPVRSWACAVPAAIAIIPSAHSSFFMGALYGSGAPDCRGISALRMPDLAHLANQDAHAPPIRAIEILPNHCSVLHP